MNTKSSVLATDFWVGLFVLIGLAAFVFLALKVGNLSGAMLGKTYTVTAAFDNIGGLKPRAPVKSAGVVVGRVADISFDQRSFQGKVQLQLDERYQFPTDSSAKILTSGLLGEQYVGLEPGGDTQMLRAGSQLSRTQSAVVLENLISQFLYSKAAEGPSAQPAARP